MSLKLNTGPTIEPVSLAQAKAHLRIDSGALTDNLTTEISIAPGSHDIAASYSLEGSSIEVSGYDVIVNLVAGACGSGGTVDVKLQESNNGTTWSDVASGSFTQVTESNDNAIEEKAYTGAYQYLRAVATVATAACEFGVEIVKSAGPAVEDDLLTAIIESARRDCELFQNRSYVTQTWELWLDEFPDEYFIELPMPPVQSVTSVKYYNTNDTEAEFSSDYYYVDTKGEPGRVVLNFGESWPSTTLRPGNGVCITYDAGYGDAGSDVPENIRRAILLLIGHYYENREAVTVGQGGNKLPMGIETILWKERVF